MPDAGPSVVLRGTTPLVLVAPHGGRRDPRARPWGSAPLKMNDLHTGALTRTLAARTGAAAIINESLDRNEIDLNRISAIEARAPAFLQELRALVAEAIGRHGHATVLTVHGWNVTEPAVDLGLGCRPGTGPMRLGPGAAVSPGFARSGVAALTDALARRGIAASLGARYPARARENVVQLFSGRHHDDPRPLIGAFGPLTARTQALQLELGAPLRWPGPWRERFVDACIDALPALTAPPGPDGHEAAQFESLPSTPRAHANRRLEFVGDGVAGLAVLDPGGGRMLVFLPDGTLLMFGGDRTLTDAPDRVGGLQLSGDEAPHLRYQGPLLHFPDTTPFLDLEQGLASARVRPDAHVDLRFEPDAPAPQDGAPTGPPHGRVHGTLTVDGVTQTIDADGFGGPVAPAAPWPRLRLSLRRGRRESLSLVIATDTGAADGFLTRDGRTVPVRDAAATLGAGGSPLDRWGLAIALVDGTRLELELAASHLLPVIRGGSDRPIRLLYACCREPDNPRGGGWCELGGY